MKILPVGSELYAGGCKDMTKIRVAFRDFAKAPKNYNNLKDILATNLQTLPFFLERKHNIRQHKSIKSTAYATKRKISFNTLFNPAVTQSFNYNYAGCRKSFKFIFLFNAFTNVQRAEVRSTLRIK
jgi:hypothetical protein